WQRLDADGPDGHPGRHRERGGATLLVRCRLDHRAAHPRRRGRLARRYPPAAGDPAGIDTTSIALRRHSWADRPEEGSYEARTLAAPGVSRVGRMAVSGDGARPGHRGAVAPRHAGLVRAYRALARDDADTERTRRDRRGALADRVAGAGHGAVL